MRAMGPNVQRRCSGVEVRSSFSSITHLDAPAGAAGAGAGAEAADGAAAGAGAVAGSSTTVAAATTGRRAWEEG
jgi:hypothetical protein